MLYLDARSLDIALGRCLIYTDIYICMTCVDGKWATVSTVTGVHIILRCILQCLILPLVKEDVPKWSLIWVLVRHQRWVSRKWNNIGCTTTRVYYLHVCYVMMLSGLFNVLIVNCYLGIQSVERDDFYFSWCFLALLDAFASAESYSETCFEGDLTAVRDQVSWRTFWHIPTRRSHIFNVIKLVTKDHLYWETIFSWPTGQSFKIGSR